MAATIKRLLCAVLNHQPDLVNWYLASKNAMPVKHTELLRKCTRCHVFLAASDG